LPGGKFIVIWGGKKGGKFPCSVKDIRNRIALTGRKKGKKRSNGQRRKKGEKKRVAKKNIAIRRNPKLLILDWMKGREKQKRTGLGRNS